MKKTTRTTQNLSNYYCQQHVCQWTDSCTRSWKNMPRGKIYKTHVFQPKDDKCEYYTDEILKIQEV